MFHGSLPSDVINIVTDIVKEWEKDGECKRIYVGCSGNFTIERALGKVWSKEIASNDVTIYSCLLGWFFSGKDFKLELKEDYDGFFTFVKGYLNTREEKIATMLILSDALNFEREKSKMSEYDYRMQEAYKSQWDTMHKKTTEKLLNMKTKVDMFYAGDVCKMVKEEVGENDAMICYPPFYSGDYEKMFEKMAKIFEWDEPEYENINKERIYEMFREMTRKRHFMFGVDEDLEEFSEFKVGLGKTTNRGRKIYIYSDSAKKRLVMPNQKMKIVPVVRHSYDDRITKDSEIELIKLNTEVFHSLRSQYMNVNINPGRETMAIGVMVDKKLVGVYAISSSPNLVMSGKTGLEKHLDMPMIYLLSDFPVNTTSYKRLAKLVLYAALSKESKLICERVTKRKVKSVSTTAFSKNQVSMKYRGIFDLLVKNKMEDVDSGNDSSDISEKYYKQGYKLCYGARMGDWTLKEGLEIWCKKHSILKKEGERNED